MIRYIDVKIVGVVHPVALPKKKTLLPDRFFHGLIDSHATIVGRVTTPLLA